MRHRASGEEDFDSLKKRLKEFKKIFVDTVDERCDSGLYFLEYHLLDHMVGDLQRFGKLSVLDSCRYAHFNLHIKQTCERNSRRRPTSMMEMVNMIERSYESALSCKKKGDDGKFGLNDGRMERIEKSPPYLKRKGIKATLDDVVRVAEVSV